MESYSVHSLSLASFSQENAFEIHSCDWIYQNLFLFLAKYYFVVWIRHMLYAFTIDEYFGWWTLQLYPVKGYSVINIDMRASFRMTCSSSGFCLVFPHDEIPIFSLHRVSHLIHLSYISNINFNHFIKCFPLSLMYTYYFFLPWHSLWLCWYPLLASRLPWDQIET